MIVPWTLLLTVLPYCWLQTPIFPPGWEAFSRHFTLLPVFPSDSCLAALAAALWPQYVSPLFFAGHGGLADTVGRFPGRGSCQAAGYPVRSPRAALGAFGGHGELRGLRGCSRAWALSALHYRVLGFIVADRIVLNFRHSPPELSDVDKATGGDSAF